MTKKQKEHHSNYDFDQTIEFTKDDLKNLRKPNRQPIDDDYFSKQLNHHVEDTENEMKIDQSDTDSSKSEQLVEENQVESSDQNNPFIYQSISEELRAEKRAEKEKAEALAREKRESFKKKFESTYEQVYDEDVIESFENYNQFEEVEQITFDFEEIENEVVESKVKRFTLPLLFKKVKASIISKFSPKSSSDVVENMNDEPKTSANESSQTKLDMEEIVLNLEENRTESNTFEETDQSHNQKENQSNLKIENDDEPLEETAAKIEEMVETNEGIEDPILTDTHFDELLINEDIEVNDIAEEEKSFVKGTAWLTAGNIISRILGALYVIPWGTWFGTSFTTANVLYSIGYNPYALFLAISTGGFPSAIAKQMAFYHSKKQYKTADKIFKYSLILMLLSGILSAGLLFILAPFIANISSTDNPQAAVIVIRSLAPALLILPIMSLLRGYFQGFGDMMPTAVSQILEQIARVVYMLAATYGIMKLWSGDVTVAVAHSTFAAFVGALLSLLYLVFLYLKRLSAIKLLHASSVEDSTINFKESMIIVLKDSIPFILLGSGIIITKFIDQITFKYILEATSTILLSDISELFGVMNLDVDKLIMIIISIAVGMSLSSIPLITSLYAKNETDRVSSLIEKIIILFLVVMLPASLGLASISNNMYEFFYPYGHEQGPSLLITASYLSIVLGAYTILSTVIQSMNYRRVAIKYLVIGLFVKLVLQFPLVAWLQAHGALIATLIAFLVSSVLMLWKIHQLVKINFKEMLPDFIIILSAALLMAISANFWNGTFDLLFGPVGRMLTFVKILLVVVISAFNYLGILALFGKISLLIGDRQHELQEKVRLF